MPNPEVPTPDTPEVIGNNASSSALAAQASEIALLEVGDGYAMLFADHAPKDVDLFGFDLLGPNASQRLVEHFSAITGVGNLVAVGVGALPQLQGIVRLAPESLQILNQTGNSLMQSAGQSLGTIVNGSGTVVAHARLLPAGVAQGAILGAALAPAMVLLAIQFQLASISRKVDENIELTRDVLRALHQDHWATLVGLHETSIRALQEADAAGTVNDHIFAPLATREADLRKCRNVFVDFVQVHVMNLAGDAKSRRSYVKQNFDQILADSHGMLMAEFAWYRAQVLRGVLISQDSQHSDANDRLLSHHVEETKSAHADAMVEVTKLLAEVESQVRLLALLPAARSLPFTAKRRSLDNALEMAEALASAVAELRNQLRPQREILAPAVPVFKSGMPDKVADILTWALPENAQLLALADANQEKLLANNVYLGITDNYFFVADQSDLIKEGSIENVVPLADVRYVRFAERTKKGPKLDIITRDENYSFTFDSWASEGTALEATRRMANVFASVMNLPAEEQRTDPLIETSVEGKATRDQIES
ncbi:hypothetical protein [Glutamicibacter sp. NPDC087673]|uniref:hypothetical protein n=1 Tax=Glutamicibacter sp. NPDC087673 TaxID=3363997 RepID=UPI0037F12978